ncbi:hypothetical protein M8R20_04520 [Pseudomonas sp. R2.Fl]|nr:hypothetical protein [Pseudomonas sp. R2.Fl]
MKKKNLWFRQIWGMTAIFSQNLRAATMPFQPGAAFENRTSGSRMIAEQQ